MRCPALLPFILFFFDMAESPRRYQPSSPTAKAKLEVFFLCVCFSLYACVLFLRGWLFFHSLTHTHTHTDSPCVSDTIRKWFERGSFCVILSISTCEMCPVRNFSLLFLFMFLSHSFFSHPLYLYIYLSSLHLPLLVAVVVVVTWVGALTLTTPPQIPTQLPVICKGSRCPRPQTLLCHR